MFWGSSFNSHYTPKVRGMQLFHNIKPSGLSVLFLEYSLAEEAVESPQKHHPPGSGELTGLKPIEVTPAGDIFTQAILSIPDHGVVARNLLLLHQCPYLLSQNVVNL